MSSPTVNASELVDTVISVAAHVDAEVEEALAEHRLTRPSFLVLDARGRPVRRATTSMSACTTSRFFSSQRPPTL